MVMTPGLRKLALTLHVITSVGFPGAVACFLALSIVGLLSSDTQTMRSAYLAMEVTTWTVILPLCFASLITGLISSLGTPWGLFRYYWIIVKLLITVPSTLILLVHMRPIQYMAEFASGIDVMGAETGGVQIQLVAASAMALVALLVATALSVYKPRGMTTYGARKVSERAPA